MTGEQDRVGLEIRVGSGFEALVGVSVLVQRGGTGWLAQLADPDAVAAAVVEPTGDTTGEVWLHLLAAATDLPGEPDTAVVAAWLADADPLRLRRAVVGADVPAWRQIVPGDVLDAAAEGRPEAVSRLLSDQRYYAGRVAAALAVLGPLDPAETKRRLVDAFERVRHAMPARLEGELLAAQRGFVRERIPVDRTDPLAVLDAAAGGFQWTPEEGIRRLVLVPQLAAAPHLLLLQHRDARVVGVPAHTDDPTRLAAAFTAVGDPHRLRILQLLTHRELGVSEVARELGIAKSTAHHHLAALRAAGLIRLVGQAWRYAYRTFDDAPEILAARLRLLLANPPTTKEET